jgi:hypothetical protein
MIPTFCGNLCWIQTHALEVTWLPLPSLNLFNAQKLGTVIFKANYKIRKSSSFPLIHGNSTDAYIYCKKKKKIPFAHFYSWKSGYFSSNFESNLCVKHILMDAS